MKKLFAFALILALALVPAAAFADDTTVVDITFDGVYVPFEEHSFQLYLPVEWVTFEITDEQAEQGIFFAAGTEDASNVMVINTMAATGYTLESLETELAASCENVTTVSINDVGFVIYDISASNASGMVALTEAGDAYNFVFAPADDADFMSIALQIMASFAELDASEEAAE